jgi:hypothetical protein
MNERIKEQNMYDRKLSEQAGLDSDVYTWNQNQLERFAELIRQDEREACAKLCDERERSNLYGVKECAAAIRERKEQP